MQTIPAHIDETLSELQEIEQDHPALRRAMDHLAESSAFTEVVRQGTNARPSVDVFWRGFRGDAQSPVKNPHASP